MEKWYVFRDGVGSTSTTTGYGTEEEAKKYCEYLNRDRRIDHIQYFEVTDPGEILRLDSGNGDFNIQEALVAILDANSEVYGGELLHALVGDYNGPKVDGWPLPLAVLKAKMQAREDHWFEVPALKKASETKTTRFYYTGSEKSSFEILPTPPTFGSHKFYVAVGAGNLLPYPENWGERPHHQFKTIVDCYKFIAAHVNEPDKLVIAETP